jgi:hypothetical protein
VRPQQLLVDRDDSAGSLVGVQGEHVHMRNLNLKYETP